MFLLKSYNKFNIKIIVDKSFKNQIVLAIFFLLKFSKNLFFTIFTHPNLKKFCPQSFDNERAFVFYVQIIGFPDIVVSLSKY